MKYQIVYCSDTMEQMEKEINSLIDLGWKPQGGVSSVAVNGVYGLCQAMIKAD